MLKCKMCRYHHLLQKLWMPGLSVARLADVTSILHVLTVPVAFPEVANADPLMQIDASNADMETLARSQLTVSTKKQSSRRVSLSCILYTICAKSANSLSNWQSDQTIIRREIITEVICNSPSDCTHTRLRCSRTMNDSENFIPYSVYRNRRIKTPPREYETPKVHWIPGKLKFMKWTLDEW